MAISGPSLMKPRNDGEAHVRSGTQFLSLAGCSHLFGAYDPYGTNSIWYCLFLLDLTSSEMAILGIFHVALCIGPVTQVVGGGGGGGGGGGKLLRWILLLLLGLRWSQTVFDIPTPLWGSLSIFSIPPRGSVPISLPLEASFSFLVAPALLLLSRRAPLLG